jgi:Xaa-Pro dipeptidase
MGRITRRHFIAAVPLVAGAALVPRVRAANSHAAATPGGTAAALASLTGGAKPITPAEHAARIAKLQGLMQQQKVAAFLMESGSTLRYFTGIDWWRSERTTAVVVPAKGTPVVVTPFFEEPSIRELLAVTADIRHWQEDEDPFALLARVLRDVAGDGALAIEPTTRSFIIERALAADGGQRPRLDGDALARACRMHKSPAELALMQVANDVTLAAIRHVRQHVEAGMSAGQVEAMMVEATNALGGEHESTLVLLNEASAFPHGSKVPQKVREGSVILVDTGCRVHGYQSDISRTWVQGTPTPRQREVWNTVKRGQEVALEAARPGAPCGAVDKAVRAYYEGLGWKAGYGLPGLSHRTGHGIGMDGHEAPYLVRSDYTPLEPGMCFSDEPGLYTPGDFGIRLEDCWHMTESGPKLFTPLAKSIDDPV